MHDLNLLVWNHDMTAKLEVYVSPAEYADLAKTSDWQTSWISKAARGMPNKVALRRSDDNELLGLMSYEIDRGALAVEIIYLESAAHSNASLLSITGHGKKYIGIAKALIAYAAKVSVDSGFDGVLFFKAKTDELRKYYMREFNAMPVSRCDPYRLVIWEDVAAEILSEYEGA